MDDPWADTTEPSSRIDPATNAPALPLNNEPSSLHGPDSSHSEQNQSAMPDPADGGSHESDDDDDGVATEEADPYAPTTLPPPLAESFPSPSRPIDDGFDDFDFDAPAASTSALTSDLPGQGEDEDEFVAAPMGDAGEDDFGDFDDFDEADFQDAPVGDEAGGDDGFDVSGPNHLGFQDTFRALSLQPIPSSSTLSASLSALLEPLYPPDPAAINFEPIRQQPPSRQILSASSESHYVSLCSAPSIKPLDWTRSRVRRDHLISLGIPVNLDEVDSHKLSAMPVLSVTTELGREAERRRMQNGSARSASAEVERIGKDRDKDKGRQRVKGEEYGRPMSAQGGPSTFSAARERKRAGLGERPILDEKRAEELCGIEEDQLNLLSLARLQKLQQDLEGTTSRASARLAWELQLLEAQKQDSATYNGMISELIATAAKAKSAQQVGGGGGVFRRSSARRPQSGAATPGAGGAGAGRVGSPGMR